MTVRGCQSRLIYSLCECHRLVGSQSRLLLRCPSSIAALSCSVIIAHNMVFSLWIKWINSDRLFFIGFSRVLRLTYQYHSAAKNLQSYIFTPPFYKRQKCGLKLVLGQCILLTGVDPKKGLGLNMIH